MWGRRAKWKRQEINTEGLQRSCKKLNVCLFASLLHYCMYPQQGGDMVEYHQDTYLRFFSSNIFIIHQTVMCLPMLCHSHCRILFILPLSPPTPPSSSLHGASSSGKKSLVLKDAYPSSCFLTTVDSVLSTARLPPPMFRKCSKVVVSSQDRWCESAYVK